MHCDGDTGNATWNYAVGFQIADFAALHPAMSCRGVQISATVGRGVSTEAVL